MRDLSSWTRSALAAAAIVAGSAAVASVRVTQPPADLIVINGRVITGAALAEAVAVRGPQIAAVGTRSAIEALKGPSTTVLDAGGATVLPGFNDSHVHFLSGAQSLQELDLSGARTLDEVQQRIRDFAAANPTAPWIRGRGWNYGPFPGGLPTSRPRGSRSRRRTRPTAKSHGRPGLVSPRGC